MDGIVDLRTAANAELMQGFCSLGKNCEFGFAQERCGANPIDLLRWAETPHGVLLRLLSERCEGIGKDLRISLQRNSTKFMVDNHHYGFRWHAFVRQEDMDASAVLKRETRRLPRLAEFFIETLTLGERIFVRVPDSTETYEKSLQIQAAIREYGPGRLLTVKADRDRLGAVEEADQGMLVGYVGQLSDPGDVPRTTQAGPWLTLCRNVREKFPSVFQSVGSKAQNGVAEPAERLFIAPDARPSRILTFHKTVLFWDDMNGVLRHGPLATSPANVFMSTRAHKAELAREDSALRWRPIEVVTAEFGGSRSGIATPPSMPLSQFEVVEENDTTFGLVRDGVFLCAEPDGRVTLSRRKLGPWEQFRRASELSLDD